MSDSVNPVPNTNEIQGYLHCALCLEESEHQTYTQELEVGRTKYGYQVWCKRHDCNVLHVGIKQNGEVILNKSRASRTPAKAWEAPEES
jgi:hypothetical protein